MAGSRAGDIFQPGELLNNTYRIENILGRGGTSEVYKARNDISGRFAAIKVLKSEFSGDEAFLTLMRREEEIREIRHDAVVRYSENHRTPEGLIYLVMDYVEGPGLDAILKSGGLPAADLVQVCRRVADGLKMAHSRRIIHRDLSPDNIILRGGKPAEAVIIDFGIAKDANPGAQTIVGNEFAGKYAYAAPEQLSGNTDARSDLYALGALLLATYRGARPDIGANPMEVLQKKALPLDTAGVPEPLKSLIDKMTQPDPAKRFQSADEIIRAIDSGATAGMDERTVVVPRASAAPSATPPKPAAVAAKPAIPAAAPQKSGGKGALWTVLVVALLAALGAGGWFGGFFDSLLAAKLAAADPYSLIVERPEKGNPRAVGYVPSDATAKGLTDVMTGLGGTAELTLASGAIGDSWGPDVLSVVKALDKVDTWRIAVNGNDAAVTGTTSDPAEQAAVMAAIGTALPGTLKGRADITLKPQFLTADGLTPLLQKAGDCGPLVLQDPPALGYGKDDTVTISGRLADASRQIALFDAVTKLAGDRKVVMNIELLNAALCLIETTLPDARAGKFSFDFGFGDSDSANPSGRYFVGENPVIDLVIPAEVTDGFVSVSIIDVSGNVFHVLPNLGRPENDVAKLRAGAVGDVKLRIAYPLADNKPPEKIAFLVDPTTLGKTKVIVIHSDRPLFAELRPTTESVGGYAAALKTEVEAGALQIRSLDSRILTSVAK